MLASKRARPVSLFQSSTDSREPGRGRLSRRLTIGNFPDEVLLNIFRYCLDFSPQSWPKLVHVCHKWRHIVFYSPQGLRLRLYCTHGTPVLKSLDCWPPLPIVVQFGGSLMLDPPVAEDEDNIMAAFKHTDRIISINLTVTRSLLEKMGTIAEPFSELADLVLLSQDTLGVALPSAFKWSSHRLRSLHLIGIALPSLPELLTFSKDLVHLQVDEIPGVGYFSPEAFANTLSGMTQLRSLSLHFLSLPSRRNSIRTPTHPRERVVLPALGYFKYRGTNQYLDSLVSRIDAPFLEDIDITFFNQLTFNISQLAQFIDRIETQKLHGRADILTSNHSISICFTCPGAPTRLVLQTSCEQLDWQLSSMAQIFDYLPTFLPRVGDLVINATPSSSGQDDANNEQWLHLIRSFEGAERFYLAGKLATNVMRTLQPADGDTTIVLPLLRNLYVEEPGPLHAPLRAAVVSFATLRRLSGRPVAVEYLQPMVSPTNLAAEEETPWELPGFVSEYGSESDVYQTFKGIADDDDQPRSAFFGPFAFLSEHTSLLNDMWLCDPLY